MPPLPNAKRERFCLEYLVDLNGAQAAIRAGYARKAARQQAHDLLTIPDVQARVAELQEEKAKSLAVTGARVIEELARVGFGNLRRLVEWSGSGVKMLDCDEVGEDAQRSVVSVKQTVRTRGRGEDATTTTETEIKIHDKVKALELLARHTGVIKDPKLGLEVPEGGTGVLAVYGGPPPAPGVDAWAEWLQGQKRPTEEPTGDL